MEINFEVTKEDYIKFNLYHVENSPSQKRNFILLRYLVPVLFSIPIYFIGTNLFKQPSVYWAIVAVLFSVIWIITYPKQYRALVKKETEKLISEGDNSEIFGQKNMIIDDEAVIIHHKSSSERILKNAIKDVKVYDDIIIIYLSSITAIIIPTRYLDKDLVDDFIKKLAIFKLIHAKKSYIQLYIGFLYMYNILFKL